MRLVVIFFLYLCLHLLGGYSYAHASTHDHLIHYPPAQRIKRTQQVENVNADHHAQLTESIGSLDDDTDRLTVDDDGDEDIIRKHLSQTRYFLAFTFAFILCHRSSSRADRLPFCTHLSYINSDKYIVQRVLRI